MHSHANPCNGTHSKMTAYARSHHAGPVLCLMVIHSHDTKQNLISLPSFLRVQMAAHAYRDRGGGRGTKLHNTQGVVEVTSKNSHCAVIGRV